VSTAVEKSAFLPKQPPADAVAFAVAVAIAFAFAFAF
jgi:hypothetical protein